MTGRAAILRSSSSFHARELIGEDDRLLRRNPELLPRVRARHLPVEAQRVIVELGERRPIAFVGVGRHPVLLRSANPTSRVVVAPAARRTPASVSVGLPLS